MYHDQSILVAFFCFFLTFRIEVGGGGGCKDYYPRIHTKKRPQAYVVF